MRYVPHEYQKRATDFIIANRYCALFLDMGLGKTVATLTALRILKDEYLEIGRTLVIAPKSVALNTWSGECRKWDHLRDTRVSIVMGTAKEREAALSADADIYVTNRDSTVWLTERYRGGKWPFDSVVIDESSSFKNPASKRFRALYRMRPQILRLVLLTGTPSPNGLMDLWSQIRLLDMGRRLGRTLGQYRDTWFRPGRRNGAVVYDWTPKPEARAAISERISDICLSMRASDWLDLPGLLYPGMDIALSRSEMRGYLDFEREQLMDIDGKTVEAVTAAALTNKLLQYTGGAVYDTEHTWHETGRSKIEALRSIAEATEEPLLVYYQYQSERDRLLREFRDLSPFTFRGEPDILDAWNGGKIRMLLCQPASVAYGLNMQRGGRTIVWYSPTWNLELYEQANARLYRQGQTRPVLIYHLVAVDTVDEAVMNALRGKSGVQSALLQRIREIGNGAKNG